MIPLRFLHRSVILALLLLAAACRDAGGDSAEASPIDRPDFSADSAYAFLHRQVEFGPRVPGTPGHAAQLAWMKTILERHADTVVEQTFSHVTRGGDTLGLTNLFARFAPEKRERVLLVTHWDTRPRSDEAKSKAERALPVPGANDGASGTAILLQLATMFDRQPPPIGVDLLFVDGEDYGPGEEDMYLGAKFFAAHLPAGYPPLYGVLLDMVGDQNPRFPMEANSVELAPEVTGRIWALAEQMGYGDIFPREVGQAISDDHIPLNRAGVRTTDIIDFEYGPGNRFWHTPEDIAANTSAETLRIVGEVMAELIYRGG
ncbi:MAG: M28 family peptidase [Longimicrobiaceae bacterium]